MSENSNVENRHIFDQKNCGNTTQATIDTQALDWFTSLSSEERSGATRFSDRAFIGTFLALATPWSTTATTTTTSDNATNHVNSTNGTDTSTPWDAMVSFNDFQRKYQEIESTLRDTPKFANRKPSTPSDGNTKIVDTKGIDDNHASNYENGNIVESYEFRIRRLQDYETSFVRSMIEHPAKCVAELTPLQKLLEEVAVIFPSAFQNITGSTHPNPQMIIRPSYFDNLSDEERFLVFQKHNKGGNLSFSPFRDDMTKSSTSLSWLRRITCEEDESKNPTMSLSVFLLARFEWAAWESFLEFVCHKSANTDVGGEICVVETDRNQKNHLLSVLGDVLSHCRAINDRSLTIDCATLERFVAPLVKICFENYPDAEPVKVDDVQNVILTPVSWVWFASQRKDFTDFDVLDKAVETSLERMDNNKEISGNSGTTAMDITTIGTGDQSLQRKKKKKNKKKKNKKIVSGESQRGQVSPTTPSAMARKVVSTPVDSDSDEAGNKVESYEHAPDDIANDVIAASIDTDSVDSDDAFDILIPPLALKSTHERNEDITIALQDGRTVVVEPLVGDVAFVVATGSENKKMPEHELSSDVVVSDNMEWDSWATVEVRGRNSRKKTSPPPSPPPKQIVASIFVASIASDSQKNTSKKLKSAKSNGSQRKKGMAQKIVGDLLFSLVDSIDDEAKKVKQLRIATPPRPVNSWKNGPPGVVQKVATSVAIVPPKTETSLRDALMGKSTDIISSTHNTVVASSIKIDVLKNSITPYMKAKEKEVATKSVSRTDQNTAPTYQDTSSSSSNVILGSKGDPQNTIDRKSDTSSNDTEEIPQNEGCEIASKPDAINTSTPPLPTLLSPANANSANSSVASSLEAPPRGRIHHHSDTLKDVNDVGYHLLDVCDRLSRDMSLFMSRRALALSARRRERGAILSALQSSVASIWPGTCHVELYGSCATQLDLPSSDIDVVVLGLSRKPYVASPVCSSNRSSSIGSINEDSYTTDDIHHQIPQLLPSASYGMLPQHRNAEQVVKLAADLEKQPWAVQVNAIPTASVPVIKVLADPSKLSGTSTGNDWFNQHQQMAGNAAIAAGGIGTFENRPNPEYSKADAGSYPPPTHVPWRGSDVMKGLLSLDITFEGPEHGGIGSTEFSSRTVAESCEESGRHPDATPFVQTLMVLKELLAQRKLNEPYSGGLSSYALLLLVLALVRERAVIREEIELVEQQRRAMTIGELNAFPTGSIPEYKPDRAPFILPSSQSELSDTAEELSKSFNMQKPDSADVKSDNITPINHYMSENDQTPTKPQPILKPSSWAMIAKMNLSSNSRAAMIKNKHATLMEKGKPLTEEIIEVKQPPVESSGQTPSVVGDDAMLKATEFITKETTKPIAKAKSRELRIENATHDAPHESNKEVRSEAATSACYSGPQPVSKTTSNISPIGLKTRAPAFYPQGYNDIVEVLCSGETSAGKLLMHFLLYYGQHFDAQSTAIDVSGKHERNYDGQTPPNSYLTPYIQRQSLGSIDPITGMLTVDPIIIYDPLEGSESNNVSRRCFAWNSVRWIFAQSYATLASAVERSATPPTSPNGGSVPQDVARDGDSETFLFPPDSNCDLMDPSSPLLRCLLSF